VSDLADFTLLEVFNTGADRRCSVGVGGADIAYILVLLVVLVV